MKYNAARKKLGIPELPSDWIVRNNGILNCRPPKDASGTAGRVAKELEIDGQGKPIYEQDIYFSGKRFQHPDPDAPPRSDSEERLTIRYNFGQHPTWECWHSSELPTVSISLSEAEALLMKWGVDRFK